MTATDPDYAEKLIISIHTALAGCDEMRDPRFPEDIRISIHTALAGCDYK